MVLSTKKKAAKRTTLMSGQPARITPALVEPEPEKSIIHVVYATRVSAQTGAQISRHVIGIFEDEFQALKLEQNFNEKQARCKEVVARAFSTRYVLPYAAPMMKDLMME